MPARAWMQPKADAALVNLRSEPRVDPSTVVGGLPVGSRLELVQQGSPWHTCRAFISMDVAELVGERSLVLKADRAFGNIRLRPMAEDPSTDVGDLKPGQRLEVLERLQNWYAVRVYVASAWVEIATEAVVDTTSESGFPVADGFDPPVGTPEERSSGKVWPGGWFDATGYAVLYNQTSTRQSVHTGADLNLNLPGAWDADAHAPCYAPAAGIVRKAGAYPVWGNIVVIEHQLADSTRLWSRLAHLEDLLVRPGERVKRGQIVGHIGDAFGTQAFHLHYDIGLIDLGSVPHDWPGLDEARIRRDYVDPLEFTKAHRPPVQRIAPRLLVGLHDREGGEWMTGRGVKGICLALATVQDQSISLDFSPLADAGIVVLLRIGYGYADGTGTLPPPDRLDAFEKAVAATLNKARGVTASHYGNEINNPSEHPGWDAGAGRPGPSYFALTPEYYIASYKRIWFSIRTDVKMGPAPLDPYFGPGSNNRDWWRAILNGISGADALFLHIKTQTNLLAEIRSAEKFTDDPLRWQYRHLRVLETALEDVPDGFKRLPIYLTEVNPQLVTTSKRGWHMDNADWVRECVRYLEDWNADGRRQPVTGTIFYRWDFDDWLLRDKPAILNAIADEARRTAV